MARSAPTDPLAGYKTALSCAALLVLGAAFLLDKLDVDTFLGMLSMILGFGIYGLGKKIERRR